MQDVAAGEPMTLADAEILYARLYKQKRTADKIELLRQIYLRYKPATLKFFVKVITGIFESDCKQRWWRKRSQRRLERRSKMYGWRITG